MTTLDPAPTTSPVPSRRRTRSLLVLAAVLLVLAVAAITVMLVRNSSRDIRYEVSSTRGAVDMISWTDNTEDRPFVRSDTPGGTVPTPWSATVELATNIDHVLVAADSAPDDTVTCRIISDGAVVAESTTVGGALCEATLK